MPPTLVAVGSGNPVKVAAVSAAFAASFPAASPTVAAFPVPSGVPDQPLDDETTLTGARNRAIAAAAAAAAAHDLPGGADDAVLYGVGLEGGIATTGELMECYAWMVVVEWDATAAAPRRSGEARTASFQLPHTVANLQSDGAVGLLTHGLIDRTAYYEHALKLALVPLVNPELFESTSSPAALASTVTMVRPAAFAANPETAASNVFQASMDGLDDTAVAAVAADAKAEFDAMVAALVAAGVTVHVVADSPEPHTPDAVFPNNWFSTHAPLADDDAPQVVIYPMESAHRRKEVRMDFFPPSARILDLRPQLDAADTVLEGTGSMVLDRANRIVYACTSSRTHPDTLNIWASANGYDSVVAFDARDAANNAPIYHTNVLMSVGASFAVICLDAIPDPAHLRAVCVSLAESGKEIIPISHAQMEHFAGNILHLATATGSVIVLSTTAHASLDAHTLSRLSAHCSALVPVAIPTIERYGGGSARCMMAEWFLDSPPVTK
ncbi:amidinotransferase [Thecamonas trahens ATCC 50062]|uniref:Amidinotransferase n=1 Tax=Thecamonas trahens ATCC 50062 TaxID=461836 RepID=A0A0L0D1G1_THETB|nr:amidinotransferase [Thecamonas trahens ATCC 50062]KNC46062.1 amidinotransferase [Thecamonas trahens ATCC 50062]|eukprot:XP_013763042.1 amidinotransferase [Thecamonas trahens ATCC 50062]